MKGLKIRTIIGLFCLVLCAASVLVAHVWKQNAYVRLSMGTVKLGKARNLLRNEITLLEVSVGGLKKRSRIEGMAKSRFGLEYGNAPVLVYVDGPSTENGGNQASTRTASAAIKGNEARGLETRGLEAGKVAWRIKGL